MFKQTHVFIKILIKLNLSKSLSQPSLYFMIPVPGAFYYHFFFKCQSESTDKNSLSALSTDWVYFCTELNLYLRNRIAELTYHSSISNIYIYQLMLCSLTSLARLNKDFQVTFSIKLLISIVKHSFPIDNHSCLTIL